MKVSVIVLTYNRAHMVTEAIGSILNQTFKDFEVIVVDNCSTDSTESTVKSYGDNRIRYFKNQNNGFMGINRNYGIEKAGGEYIAFLDDDDLWLPEKLEMQVALLDSNRELGLVYADCYLIDSNGNPGKTTYFHGRKPVRGYAFNELLRNNPIPMLTVMLRKEALNEVGVFNPGYKIALDYDLWLRIAEYYPIDFIKKPLARYRVHGESGYQKNMVSAYQEDLKIMDYWLNKSNREKGKLTGRIKQTKVNLHRILISCHFMNHNRREAFQEVVKLIKLLPYSLKAVPSVIASLGRSLARH